MKVPSLSILDDLRGMAFGGLPERLPKAGDLPQLFQIALAPDLEEACVAAAVAARLLAGQERMDQALTLIDDGRSRLSSSHHNLLGLLDWAESNVLLNGGQISASSKAFARAQQRFTTSPNWPLLTRICLDRAEQMLLRWDLEEAAILSGNARSHALRAGEPGLAISALRCAAEIALLRGYQEESKALFHRIAEESQSLDDPSKALLQIALGHCAIALLSGQLTEAEEALAYLGETQGDLLDRAAVGRRRAEIRLRQGRYTEALATLKEGLQIFEDLGMRAASATQLRMMADVQAAGGDPVAAAENYRLALRFSCVAGDFHGARRCCHHLSTLERSSEDSPLLPLLDAMQVDLDSITAPPVELTR